MGGGSSGVSDNGRSGARSTFLTLKGDLTANEELGLTEVEAASDGGSVRIEGWDE